MNVRHLEDEFSTIIVDKCALCLRVRANVSKQTRINFRLCFVWFCCVSSIRNSRSLSVQTESKYSNSCKHKTRKKGCVGRQGVRKQMEAPKHTHTRTHARAHNNSLQINHFA